MSTLSELFKARFGADLEGPEALFRQANHRSVRAFADRPVGDDLVMALAATALSAPTKSDLQQADIILIDAPEARATVAGWFPDDPWIGAAPRLLVFCGNNRRQRQIAEWRGHTFANDHLDAFFNATVDAAIVLSAFVIAAETVGLGCCPISAMRDRAADLSDLLGLPEHVFPIAGLALGWPAAEAPLSPRLPLDVTVHRDRHQDLDRERLAGYDRRRMADHPYARQRDEARFGTAVDYGWSEDKARQYAHVQRADFGAFIRVKGFTLD